MLNLIAYLTLCAVPVLFGIHVIAGFAGLF